jgi:hypothetical protein
MSLGGRLTQTPYNFVITADSKESELQCSGLDG